MESDKIKELETALRKEREGNLSMSRFLARTSHFVRTPITAVLGVSEIMLRDTTLPAHVEEAFAKIYSSAKILLGAANDIIDLPRLGTGEFPLVNAPYDIAGLIGDVTQLHLVHLGSRKIEYNVKICPKIPATLFGDELRIKQILDNLLANAFHYTDSGSVELKAHWEAIQDNSGNLVFILTDTGLSRTQDVLDFDKVNYAGIPLLRGICKMLNAKISVSSAPEAGTQITVRIPQAARTEETIGKETTGNLARFHTSSQITLPRPEPMPYGRVLVVDDVDVCQFVVKGMLGFYKIETELALGGAEAVEKINNGHIYDIIFMDHIMPGMDGVTATKVIREAGYTAPVVALTANAMFGQETEYLKNGFDAYLSKPIDQIEMDTLLRKFIRDKQPQHVLDAVAAKEKDVSLISNENELPPVEESHCDVAERLRIDFARKQRDVFTEITIALSNGKPETARWHLDTVKNMAGMIGEPVLTKIAADVSHAIGNGEVPTRLLEMLNQELITVLAGIPEEENGTGTPPSEVEIIILLEKLYDLLDTDCAECLFLIEKLQLVPHSEELVLHIKNFDFPKALKSLARLRNRLKEEA